MAAVLVVDDDPDIVMMLTMLLEDEGHAVHVAVGLEAVTLARANRPQLILLDVNMPGADGLEVAYHLRSDPCTRDIPIVLMSATHRLRERARDAPVTALLPKPFEFGALLECVRQLADEPVTS